jgi:inosose dehydratase
MGVDLGINPISWTNDDLPGLGDDIPLETCLGEARAAGFAGVELGRKFPRDAERLRPILERHELRLVSGWYSSRLLERDATAEWQAMQSHFRLLAALGCRVVIVAEVTGCVHGDRRARLSARPQLARERWAEFGARLSELAERMQQHGLRMAYHHHMGTVVQTGQEVDRLMEQTSDAVGLLLDTGHLHFAGDDPIRYAGAYRSRIAHVHCKDVRPAVLSRALNRDASFLDAVIDGVFTVPGDGCIDYRAVLAPLAEQGYRGWWVVEAEQDPAVAPPARYAALGHRHLQGLTRSLYA